MCCSYSAFTANPTSQNRAKHLELTRWQKLCHNDNLIIKNLHNLVIILNFVLGFKIFL